MATAANTTIFSRMKKKKQQLDIGGSYCSICGKKLKKFIRRRRRRSRARTTSENPLACWQCMILDNNSNF
jgi:hypothetical protein